MADKLKEIGHYLEEIYRRVNYAKTYLFARHPHANTGLCLNFDLNDGCNINCVMCGNKRNPARQQYLALDSFSANVAGLFGLVDDFQYGCQYEPLMHPHFEASLYLIAQNLRPGVRGGVVSNGTLFDKPRRQAIIASGIFRRVRISFDGATRATYETIRRGARFDLVLANIDSFLAEREAATDAPELELNFTVMRANIRELPDVITLAASLGIKTVTTHKLYPDDYGAIDPDYRALLARYIQAAGELASRLGVAFTAPDYGGASEDMTDVAEGKNYCGYLESPLVLMLYPDGGLLTGCRQVIGPLGNVLAEGYERIAASRRYRTMTACFRNYNPRICPMCYMSKLGISNAGR